MDNKSLIIFSDLDGTLLDHYNYSWQPALPALKKLHELQVPVILCSSKTAAEVAEIHQAMELKNPYIVENGAGIIFPTAVGSAHFFGRPYAELLQLLQKIRSDQGFLFSGFNDLSVAQIAEATGLKQEQAELAKQRLCTEPLRWDDSAAALKKFRHKLAENKLKLLQGGRFYHVIDISADKGTALKWLLADFRRNRPQSDWFSIALGDGPNDQDMLEAADLAVIIPSVTGRTPDPRNNKILHATESGPIGWNRAILNILDLYSIKGADHG